MNAQIPWPWVLLVLIPAWAAFVLWVIGRLSGWHRLARRYRAVDGRPREGAFEFVGSGSFGLGNYNGCLIAGATPAGVYLALWWPFSFGHPALLIPWAAIRRAEERKVFWVRGLVLTVGSDDGRSDVEITLRHRALFPAIRAALGERAGPPPLP